jgi:Putative bacterial virulence factor.
VGTRVSADDILGDIFGESTESAPPAQENGEAQARDMAGVFASLVMEHWIGRLRDLGASGEARAQLGLPALELDQLCHEIILAASRCRLREILRSACGAACPTAISPVNA